MKLLLLIALAGIASAGTFFQPLDFGKHNPPDIHFSDQFHFSDEGPKWEAIPQFSAQAYGKTIDCDPEPVPQSGVPEPATFGVMGLGLIGLAMLRKR